MFIKMNVGVQITCIMAVVFYSISSVTFPGINKLVPVALLGILSNGKHFHPRCHGWELAIKRIAFYPGEKQENGKRKYSAFGCFFVLSGASTVSLLKES